MHEGSADLGGDRFGLHDQDLWFKELLGLICVTEEVDFDVNFGLRGLDDCEGTDDEKVSVFNLIKLATCRFCTCDFTYSKHPQAEEQNSNGNHGDGFL